MNECGLRPCCTWANGYCGYRCLAALRDTTMKTLIKDVLSALLGQEGEQNTIINVVERKKELQRVLIALSTTPQIRMNSCVTECTPPLVLHCVQPYRRCKTLFNRYDIWAKAYEEWDLAAHTSVHYILPMKILILQDPDLLTDGIEGLVQWQKKKRSCQEMTDNESVDLSIALHVI